MTLNNTRIQPHTAKALHNGKLIEVTEARPRRQSLIVNEANQAAKSFGYCADRYLAYKQSPVNMLEENLKKL